MIPLKSCPCSCVAFRIRHTFGTRPCHSHFQQEEENENLNPLQAGEGKMKTRKVSIAPSGVRAEGENNRSKAGGIRKKATSPGARRCKKYPIALQTIAATRQSRREKT